MSYPLPPPIEPMLATLANGWFGYVPTQDAFARGGYEPLLAFQSRLARDAGDQIVSTALELLGDLAPS